MAKNPFKYALLYGGGVLIGYLLFPLMGWWVMLVGFGWGFTIDSMIPDKE